MNLDNINIPENIVLRRVPERNVMGDRVSPRWHTTIGSQELAEPGLKLDPGPFVDGFPLVRGVEPLRQSLHHLVTRRAKQERVVRGSEVLVVTALESDYGLCAFDKLDGPPGSLAGGGGSVSLLGHGHLVFLGYKVLVMVATEADRFGVAEEVHYSAKNKKKTLLLEFFRV